LERGMAGKILVTKIPNRKKKSEKPTTSKW